MTTLTLDMMLEVMRKVGPPPPKQEIHCGDMDEFIHAFQRRTGQEVARHSKHMGSFGGIEIRTSKAVPVDKAIVFEDGKIKSIINLRDETEQSK
ncbi:hypothetical protein VWX96_17335 [Phaeobacter sp. A90a-4f]|uniref:hypothetical protein n=1 Tax=unclassified Phaeobacter TaxID=2621772 RepID=UPI003A85C9D4